MQRVGLPTPLAPSTACSSLRAALPSILRALPLIACLVPSLALCVSRHVRARKKAAATPTACGESTATELCAECELPIDELTTMPAEAQGGARVATPLAAGAQQSMHSTPRKSLLAQTYVGPSKDPLATTKRDCYIDWDDYFMSVAVLSSFRSKDPNRQVGACVIEPETNRIVAIGYNGFPSGCSDDALPWARSASSPLETKYPYVFHAEMNAILNKNCESLKGCRMYVTLFPCNECAKLIIQSRVAEVVFFSDRYHDSEMMTASRRMLRLARVSMRQHRPNASRIVIDFDALD